MSGNEARGTREEDHFERFDSLPDAFRNLLKYCHTNYQVGWIERLIDGFGGPKAYDLTRNILWSERRADIIRHYGTTHPEVRR